MFIRGPDINPPETNVTCSMSVAAVSTSNGRVDRRQLAAGSGDSQLQPNLEQVRRVTRLTRQAPSPRQRAGVQVAAGHPDPAGRFLGRQSGPRLIRSDGRRDRWEFARAQDVAQAISPVAG
jgi:hypothetical protein